jgi:hypothetical protein
MKIPNTSQPDKYLEFVESLDKTSTATEFVVGQKVAFVNDYGVIFDDCTIIGFAKEPFQGRFIHLDIDSYWFPANPSRLRIIGADGKYEIRAGEVVY